MSSVLQLAADLKQMPNERVHGQQMKGHVALDVMVTFASLYNNPGLSAKNHPPASAFEPYFALFLKSFPTRLPGLLHHMLPFASVSPLYKNPASPPDRRLSSPPRAVPKSLDTGMSASVRVVCASGCVVLQPARL